jgi:hypothetical protein
VSSRPGSMAMGADWLSAASFRGWQRAPLPDRLQRSGVPHGMDGRLLPGQRGGSLQFGQFTVLLFSQF